MRWPSPASGLRASVLAISAVTHAPVTTILPLFRIDTAPWPLVQINTTPSRCVQRAIRTARKILSAHRGRPRRPRPADCHPSQSEEKDRLKRWKNRLQLSRNLHGLKFLQLLRVQDRHELREKSLLCLRHLLLQRVNLNHHDSHLCRVSAGVQQIAQLLNERLSRLE